MEGLFHYHRRKRGNVSSAIRSADRYVIFGACLALFLTLPQVFKIWIDHTAAGVSLVSWSAYLVNSVIWLYYGFLHKSRMIIVSYALWILLDALIVIGILVFR